jgi:hypothetical protein
MSDDSTAKPIEWVEYQQAPPKPDGDGLPCPHCAKKLDRFDVHRDGNGDLVVRISYKIPAKVDEAEVDGVCHLLQSFIHGLGGKPKTSSKTRPRRKRKGV